MKSFKLFFSLLLFSIFMNCSSESEHTTIPAVKLPEKVKGLKNLTIIDANTSPLYSTKITEDRVFTETEDVFWGNVGSIAVDNMGRLYLETGGVDQGDEIKVLVFNNDGKFLQSVGRYGRGPGEFEHIQDIQVTDRYLYVFERYRFHKFKLGDLTLEETIAIELNGINRQNVLKALYPTGPYFVFNDSVFVAKFSSLSRRVKTGGYFNYFTLVNSRSGRVSPDWIIREKDFKFYNTTEDGALPNPVPFAMPFSPSPQIAATKNGTFYSNFNDSGLIKIHGFSGEYAGALFLNIPPAPLTTEVAYDLGFVRENKKRLSVLEEEGIPENWPLINSLQTDHKQRLWISTITQSDSTYTWLVLNSKHDLLARFEAPGIKNERSVWHPKDLVIRNNYLYQIAESYNPREGASIIRYKVQFTKP